MNKYGNERVVFMGDVFDSKAERSRFIELSLLEKAGKISGLQRQVKFELIPKQPGERAVDYIADFAYTENGVNVAEDVKSEGTRRDKAYVIKRKLFKQKYPGWIFREEIR